MVDEEAGGLAREEEACHVQEEGREEDILSKLLGSEAKLGR